MSPVASQLSAIRDRVSAACRKAGRPDDAVTLVAVSKTFPASYVSEAVAAGQRSFGENKLQEAEPKIVALPGGLEWHFIGGVQRNKVRKILPLFPYIHAVDSLKLASYMDGVAAGLGSVPKIFLQVNQAGEESKGGFSEDDLRSSLSTIAGLAHLEVVGLMVIPPEDGEPRRWFRALREFRDKLESEFHVRLPYLSMGMSGDFEAAIEEGATHVRVGSSIFGKRAGYGSADEENKQ